MVDDPIETIDAAVLKEKLEKLEEGQADILKTLKTILQAMTNAQPLSSCVNYSTGEDNPYGPDSPHIPH